MGFEAVDQPEDTIHPLNDRRVEIQRCLSFRNRARKNLEDLGFLHLHGAVAEHRRSLIAATPTIRSQGTWRWTRNSAIRRSMRSGSSEVLSHILASISGQSTSVPTRVGS